MVLILLLIKPWTAITELLLHAHLKWKSGRALLKKSWYDAKGWQILDWNVETVVFDRT